MLTFLTAVYNETSEISDLLKSVIPSVDKIVICDDGSTDNTVSIIYEFARRRHAGFIVYTTIPHTGLPETAKNEALKLVEDKSWVLMLDADERLSWESLKSIRDWTYSTASKDFDYVYCRQVELIDGVPVREFQKCKLFRKEAISFPLNNIHADDQFSGKGDYRADWVVSHRKTSTKQITREVEYLETYKKLLNEGKIDQGRYEWLTNLHHYVKPHG